MEKQTHELLNYGTFPSIMIKSCWSWDPNYPFVAAKDSEVPFSSSELRNKNAKFF